MSDSLSAYLDVMGIEQWVLRGRGVELSGVVADVVEGAPADAPLQVTSDTVDTGITSEQASETVPAPVLKAASLADFPANVRGQILIVCGPVSAVEGPGSAFNGAPAELLNAMLGATQWPADQCVLLEDVTQLSLALEQVQPNILVALGEAASQAVVQGAVQSKRQTVHSLASTKAVVSYHPVKVQQDPKQFKRPIWEDLKLAMAEVAKADRQ